MTQPLHILVDARMLIGRFAGVARCVTSLLRSLSRLDGVCVTALTGQDTGRLPVDLTSVDVMRTDFSRRERSPARRLWWEETKLRGWIRRAGPDVYHATWNSGIPPMCPVPCILTVHDLIPLRHSGDYFATPWGRLLYSRSLRSSLRRADFVTTVSDHVRHDMVSRGFVKEDRVIVVPNGVDPPRNPARTAKDALRDRAAPFVLYVGGHEKRKNVAGLFAAMNAYWGHAEGPLDLYLTGTPDALCPEAARVYAELRCKQRVVFLGQPADDELAKYYASAEALLLLSRDEGFGLPVLEAMAQGCPVIAAARAALPETVGDAGLLVDPDDANAVARLVARTLADSGLRRSLIERGRRRAVTLTWRRTAERMLAVYRHVAGAGHSVPRQAVPVCG